MENFFKNMFCCGTHHDVIDFEEEENKKNKAETEEIYAQITKQKIPNSFLTDTKYILPLEYKNIYPFTKDKIIEFIDGLDDQPRGFKLHSNDHLQLYCNKDGSLLNKDLFFGCSLFTINKPDLYKEAKTDKRFTLRELNEYFICPEKRKAWDKGVFSMDNIEDLSQPENGLTIIIFHAVFNSPIFGVDKRDMVDKRILFEHKNVLYYFQSSIEENYGKELCPVKEGVVRALSYINACRITEDETQYHFVNYYQTDPRIFIPETFLQMAVPFTISKYYKTYVKMLMNELKNENKAKDDIRNNDS